MKPTIFRYFFDPLCGWCYGASRGIQALASQPNVVIELRPTGLFSQSGRIIDAHFAQFARQNDERIAQLSGAEFSSAYQQNVLGKLGQAFDSFPANQALFAVAQTQAEQGLQALVAIQQARYQQGRDITDFDVLRQILKEQGLQPALDFWQSAPDLAEQTAHALRHNQQLFQQQGLQGVPCLQRQQPAGWQTLDSAILLTPNGRIEALLG